MNEYTASKRLGRYTAVFRQGDPLPIEILDYAGKTVARAETFSLAAEWAKTGTVTEGVEVVQEYEPQEEYQEQNLSLMGVAELAEFTGLSKSMLTSPRFKKRMPPPIQKLKSGPVWERSLIEEWWKAVKDMYGKKS